MRARLIFAGASALLALSVTPAAAHQEGFTLSGSVRLRYEGLNGQFRPGADTDESVVGLRSSILAQYRRGGLDIGAEVFDSRIYGADRRSPISANDINTLEPVQAYVGAALNTGAGPVHIRAGRFTMDLGARRLVALNGYRNTTNAFTGVRLDYGAPTGATATLFYTLPQIRTPSDIDALLDNRVRMDDETFNLQFLGARAAVPLSKRMSGEISAFQLNEQDSAARATRDRRLTTLSARLITPPAQGRWDFEVEGAYQFGRISETSAPGAGKLEVSAYFLHAEAGRQLAGAWRPRVSIEYEIASGDGPKASYGRFDTLYGARRTDFGPSGIYALIGRTNISSPGLRIEVSPNRRLEAFLAYRLLWAESARDGFSTSGVIDSSGQSGTYAGKQLEGRLQYWLRTHRLRLDLNAAILTKGRLLRDAPSALWTGDAHYLSTALIASF